LNYMAERISKFRFQFNDGNEVFKMPMVQATAEGAAWRIVENGFGTVATTDEGFYGKGIYFTSDFSYAEKYVQLQTHQVFLIALTLPGNPFPVVEHPYRRNKKGEILMDQNLKKIVDPNSFFGKPCTPGYQSHYTIVPKKNIGSAFPIEDAEINPAEHADELAIFQEAQILPLFLFYYDNHQYVQNLVVDEKYEVSTLIPKSVPKNEIEQLQSYLNSEGSYQVDVPIKFLGSQTHDKMGELFSLIDPASGAGMERKTVWKDGVLTANPWQMGLEMIWQRSWFTIKNFFFFLIG